MKTNRLLLVSLLGLAAPLVGHAAAPAPADPRAEVAFFEPEKFTDVKDSYMSADVRRTTYLDQIRDHILDRSKNYIPAGWHLQVTITDVDMAGDFEPWRGPQFDDVRIIKDMYPPKIDLTFRLTDAEGNVVKEGKRTLRDTSFLMKITPYFNTDTMRHEKALLDDWMAEEFPRQRK
jgi:hypothetical protein